MITDAQVHIWEPDRPESPWPARAEGRPMPARLSFSAEEMIAAMDAIGVNRAVIVPPAWAGENNAPALAAAAKYPGRFAVMGRLDPYANDTNDRLEGWLGVPHMRGIRMSSRWGATPKQFLEGLEDGSLGPFWGACERLSIPVACIAGLTVGSLGRVAEHHPGLRLIVDHMATLDRPTAAESFGAIDDLVALARHPHILVKLGTGPNRSKEAYPFADVHSYLRRIYDAFGPGACSGRRTSRS